MRADNNKNHISRTAQDESFQKAFVHFSEAVEHALQKMLLILLLLLIAVQLLMQIPEARSKLSRIEPLEGVPFPISDDSIMNR